MPPHQIRQPKKKHKRVQSIIMSMNHAGIPQSSQVSTSNLLRNQTHKPEIHNIQVPRGKTLGEYEIGTLVHNIQREHSSSDIYPIKSKDFDQDALINMAWVDTKNFEIY
uniref:Uncharacterized protein n=1 Tax=Physcomitrium patens TaxID=3218 RepID=A0A2K1JM12_PHYPA|nr:hypothetical protein PHYPA_017415 [Physcomitrium patens]